MEQGIIFYHYSIFSSVCHFDCFYNIAIIMIFYYNIAFFKKFLAFILVICYNRFNEGGDGDARYGYAEKL